MQENRLVEEHRAWIARAVLPAYLAAAAPYLLWRSWTTLEWGAWYLWPLLACEAASVAFTILYLATSGRIAFPAFRPAPEDRTVDVFIPTYNEPREIVEMTTIGALHVRGARRVFVLDDGCRPEIREMAEAHGAAYVSRADNRHAKAGNMNAGIRHSDAEFMLFLDCDHVPQPQFIERTLGYFADEKLAFVQTPQLFYNPSSVQFRRTAARPLWNEQSMFYEAIQPSKNVYNAAFFCGSGALVRRAAIDSIGGFATGTATEDIHTSLRLHARGWRSLFVREPLAYGIAPVDLAEYHKQRTRWGAGSLGLLFRSEDSPLRARGLTAAQRLCYFNSTAPFTTGLLRIFYIAFPALVLVSIALGAPSEPVAVLFYLPIILAFLAFSCGCAWVASGGTYHPRFTEEYNLANMFSHAMALRGIVRVQRKFSVSAKRTCGRSRSPVETGILLLALALAAATLAGLGAWFLAGRPAAGLLESMMGLVLFWNICNLVQILLFLAFLRRHGAREDPPCALAVPNQAALLSGGACSTRDATMTGLDLRGAELTVRGGDPERDECSLAFYAGNEWIEIAARVEAVSPAPGDERRVQLRFGALPPAAAVAITLHLFHKVVPETLRYGPVPTRRAGFLLLTGPAAAPAEASPG